MSIESAATALEATDASITATGLRIAAPRAMRLDHSRLDLAALQVSAREFGDDRDDSLVFFSLGYWCDGADEWRLHDVLKPRKGALDPQLRKLRGVLRTDAPAERCPLPAPINSLLGQSR